jgi:hypothetical protein
MKNSSARFIPFCVHRMSFDGQVLERGFWLYIWKISTSRDEYVYVGRTGDSSSPNAASPFRRIGQHLDSSDNAKANSLARRLRECGINPLDCKFEMYAIGPLFPEQDSMEKHRPIRDKVAALEHALGETLRAREYNVLGTQRSRKQLDQQIFEKVLRAIDQFFPPRWKF